MMPKWRCRVCKWLSAVVLLVAIGSLRAADEATKPGSVLDPLVELIGQVDDPAFRLDLLKGIYKAVQGRRRITMPKGWQRVSKKLARSPNAQIREIAKRLSLIFGDQQAIRELRMVVPDANAAVDERQDALVALVQVKDSKLLPILLNIAQRNPRNQGDILIRAATIRGLAAYNDPSTPHVLVRLYPHLTDDEKHDAISTLASRPQYALVLLDAIEHKQIARRDVSAFVARQLSRFQDKRVSEKLNKVWGTVRPTVEEKSAVIKRYKSILTSEYLKNADKSNGRLVFSKTCASCHKLFGDGKKIGPELTGSQRTNLDYILQNLIDPDAIIGRDFRMSVIVTTEGRVVTGIVKEEVAKSITVQTPNEVIIIPKDEIEVRERSNVSMMPADIISKLKQHEIRDLIAYLSSDGQVPLPNVGDRRD